MHRFIFTILALSAIARAQVPATLELPPALTASGTGVIVGGGSWGYVVWQASDPTWHANHDVAIYLKPGDADSASPFVRQGTATLIDNPTTIKTWAARAQKLADATGGLAENLTICHNNARRLIELWSPTPSPVIPPALEDRVSMLAVRAGQEPGAAAALRGLGNSHPLFRFVTGTGWAGPLNVATGQDATVELRDIDRATGAEGAVLGRVTVRASAMSDPRISPDIVTAPGTPIQVPPDWPAASAPVIGSALAVPRPTELPDLAPALRWSLPDELRRQSLLSRGFMLWVGETGANYSSIPSLIAAASVANPSVRAVLRNPAPVSKLFRSASDTANGPLVTDFAADGATWFASDDHGRYLFSTPPQAGMDPVFDNVPYVPNSLHYYYLACADLLGRYGPRAALGTGRAVHTLPPKVPHISRVENIMSGGSPRLRLSITPNANASGEVPTHRYLVFRDRSANTNAPLSNALGSSVDPSLNSNLIYIGALSQPADTSKDMVFTDTNLTPAATSDFGQTYFYCVRAVHDTPLGMNLSPPSPAVFGTIRDRSGPPAASGFVQAEAPRAGAWLTGSSTATDASIQPGKATIRLQIRRLDPGISKVIVKITSLLPGEPRANAPMERTVPDLMFGNANSLTFDYPIGRGPSFSLSLTPVTIAGRKGKSISFTLPYDSEDQTKYQFECDVKSGQLLQMSPSDPFWIFYFTNFSTTTSFAFTPVSSPDGTYSATFPGAVNAAKARSLLIQARPGSSGGYTNIATARLAPGQTQFFFRNPNVYINPEYYVWEVLDPAGDTVPPFPLHKPFAGGSTQLAPIYVGIILPVGTYEYRLYRRMDDGPLFLMKQDNGTWNPEQLKTTIYKDEIIPPAGGLISYFAQTFDQNGNPGPLALIGQKVGIIPELPVPVLDAIETDGSTADPMMFLRASCPAGNVERLEIKISPNSKATTGLVIQNTPPGTLVNFTGGGKPTAPQAYDATAFTEGLLPRDPTAPLVYTRSVRISAGIDYVVQVRALGAYGTEGGWSAPQKFTWSPPIEASAIPWPVRSFPQITSWNPAVSAFALVPSHFDITTAEGDFKWLSPFGGIVTAFPNGTGSESSASIPLAPSQLPVAVQIGVVPTGANAMVFGVNYSYHVGPATIHYTYGNLGLGTANGFDGTSGPTNLFQQFLFQKTKTYGDINSYDFSKKLLPFALYRRQTHRKIAGIVTAVPDADLVQVSPLIRDIAWRTENNHAVLVDPNVRAVRTNFSASPDTELSLCVMDTAPAATGATYAYYLVHFTPEGEPDLIHSCGSTPIPTTP